ncbi:hypothetical protein Xmau_03600 [Xenorhabdus mauleonii]|uniref:Uncharacterized protein n=1 Tax=Xenorhabdus mauleonii TaxID=351675 RepID=A0A1I3X5K0_9GAMM|nr:hypothetical protein [Xenorhabdus mauleonii]PHM38213.1 hypothetical protein Xmau_03600 [Xenorhabdus mauleonii]SFK14136.1 hypothetical protein SAMN05421680_13148 [Xenorhabdus mauleonii]
MNIMLYNVSQVLMGAMVTGGGIPNDPIKQHSYISPGSTFTFTIYGDFIEQIRIVAHAVHLDATFALSDSSILNKYQKFSLHYQDGCSVESPFFDYCFPISIIPVDG